MKDIEKSIVERKDIQGLFDALKKRGYQISGPTLRDNAVIYDQISSIDELPIGWTDTQEKGNYRLTKGNKSSLFGYVVGPYSWKRFLYPPERKLMEVKREGTGFAVVKEEEAITKQAFVGVRPCELSAIAIQDKVLMEGPYADASYKRNRTNAFIVAVNCLRPGGTCFCSSMKTGPAATKGFDLAVTEMIEPKRHYFLVEVGSKEGSDVLKDVPNTAAGTEEIQTADKAIQKAAGKMGRSLDMKGIKELLDDGFDDGQWAAVAKRCLTCGNCTMVCPTCFCINVEDTTGLTGQQAQRFRKQDSCFTVEFSYIHGGSIRTSEMSRYRQWMMHKLAYWQDQFGLSGCVGCGRCITWCPVGIDITEEAGHYRKKG